MHNILKPYQLLADIRDFCHFNISHSWVIGYNMKINISTSLVTCSVPVFALLGYIVVETKIELSKHIVVFWSTQEHLFFCPVWKPLCLCCQAQHTSKFVIECSTASDWWFWRDRALPVRPQWCPAVLSHVDAKGLRTAVTRLIPLAYFHSVIQLLFSWNVLLCTVSISKLVLKGIFVSCSATPTPVSHVKKTSLKFLLKALETVSTNLSHECAREWEGSGLTEAQLSFNVSKAFIHPDNLSPFLKLSLDLGRRFT